MKRWISPIVLLAFIGILGAGFYYYTIGRTITTPTTAQRTNLIATSTVMPTTQPSTITPSQPLSTSTSGRLIMIDPSFYPDHKLVLFDLATEELTTLFNVPENGWIYQINISQDGRQLAMAYSAPPISDERKDCL